MHKKPGMAWMALTRAGLLLGVVTLIGSRARAQSLKDVTYLGGTALQGSGLHGKVSVTPTDALVFEGPARLMIAYDHVISYESSSHKKIHVGLLTEGIWRLLAPWPEAKQLSISYRDQDDHPQVVVLQMSRADEALLVEVLKTRASGSKARQITLQMRRPALGQGRPAER